jgi:hypothetical protein
MYLPARKLTAQTRVTDLATPLEPAVRASADEARERIAAVRLKLQAPTRDEDVIGAAKGPRSALTLGSV